MRRILFFAAPALLAFSAFAADGLGTLHSFRDWDIGCDNARRCEAQGYGSERDDAPAIGRAALIVRREAGPAQPPRVRFAYSQSDRAPPVPAPGQTVRVQLAALRFAMPTTSTDVPEPEVPAVHVPALLAAVLKGDAIVLSAGQGRWQVSLDGAKAALLKMDALQGRVGTPGALVAKGAQPEAAVPKPKLPVLPADRLPPTTAADLQLAASLGPLLHSEADCPGIDLAVYRPELLRLTPNRLLVVQPCTSGAYQTSSRVWLVDDRPPHRALRLDLPLPDGSTADMLVHDSLSPNAVLKLQESAKLRGIGDCWASHEWTWSGGRLVLVSASVSPCRLFEAGGLALELWRAEVEEGAAR